MATSTMATVEEVKALLLDACPGADVSSICEEDHRITGEVRWRGFSGWTDRQRSDHIIRMVRDPLGMRGMRIGVLYLLTPREKLDD